MKYILAHRLAADNLKRINKQIRDIVMSSDTDVLTETQTSEGMSGVNCAPFS